MRHIQTRTNPFMMMTDPEVILQAVERSERLNRLSRQICRPLDKPLIPKLRQADLDAYDMAIEADTEVEALASDDSMSASAD